jgi:hypothetical protein
MSRNSTRVLISWVLVLAGAAIALLIAWAAKVVKVPPGTLLAVAVVVIALSWLVALVAVPWNLYFAARRAAQEMAVSRERGIAVRPAYDAEAGQISRRMLWLALGGHAGTALAAAGVAFFSGNKIGYYLAGVFLLSTVFRPAAAYLSHVRERIGVMTFESAYPRDDVIELRQRVDEVMRSTDVLTADLRRLHEAQQAERAQARSRDDDLRRQVDQMVRRIEATVDGISDHQELLAGLRALVRMVRSEPA